MGYTAAIQARIKPTRFDQQLRAQGIMDTGRKKIYSRIWHQWLPRRVNTFLWLLQNEGLPLGSWLEKMTIDGSCKLCVTSPIETARHAFIDCPLVARAWMQFNKLRTKHQCSQLQYDPADILEGASLNRPGLII